MLRVLFAYITRVLRVYYAYPSRILRVCYAYPLRILRAFFAYITRILRVYYAYSSRILRVFFAYVTRILGVYCAYSSRMSRVCVPKIMNSLTPTHPRHTLSEDVNLFLPGSVELRKSSHLFLHLSTSLLTPTVGQFSLVSLSFLQSPERMPPFPDLTLLFSWSFVGSIVQSRRLAPEVLPHKPSVL